MERESKEVVPAPKQNTATTVYHIIKGEKVMAGSLTAEQIQALMAGRSRKGLYLAKLNEFVKSGEGGVCVHDEWPLEFADKNATATKQGFENAKNSKNRPEGADNVLVINNDEKTFLINPAAAGVEAPDTDEVTEEDAA